MKEKNYRHIFIKSCTRWNECCVCLQLSRAEAHPVHQRSPVQLHLHQVRPHGEILRHRKCRRPRQSVGRGRTGVCALLLQVSLCLCLWVLCLNAIYWLIGEYLDMIIWLVALKLIITWCVIGWTGLWGHWASAMMGRCWRRPPRITS